MSPCNLGVHTNGFTFSEVCLFPYLFYYQFSFFRLILIGGLTWLRKFLQLKLLVEQHLVMALALMLNLKLSAILEYTLTWYV